jgi:nucleoside-diphosphate-sugar epimerase
MRLLVLGGTAWLGRQVAAAATAAGHDVVCLARGSSGDVAPRTRLVVADRSGPGAYDGVAADSWDAVVDVARQPGHVRGAVAALVGRVQHYVYVSSCSAYADNTVPGQDESAALLPALEADVMESVESYGEAKVACERAVADAVGPDRCALVRAGLIAGHGDPSDRAGYWPMRFAHPAGDDGAVLVPDSPTLGMQLVDVEDLAAWIVLLAEERVAGPFNAVGPSAPLGDLLAAAREAAGHAGPLVTVDQDWLVEHGVEPWAGRRSLPLWLPLPEYAGFGTRDVSSATAAGLRTRPLVETMRAALAWEEELGVGRERNAGLSDGEERELLAARTR